MCSNYLICTNRQLSAGCLVTFHNTRTWFLLHYGSYFTIEHQFFNVVKNSSLGFLVSERVQKNENVKEKINTIFVLLYLIYYSHTRIRFYFIWYIFEKLIIHSFGSTFSFLVCCSMHLCLIWTRSTITAVQSVVEVIPDLFSLILAGTHFQTLVSW